MKHRITHLLAIGAVAAMACSSQPVVTTTTRTTTTSSGDVDLVSPDDMWLDSAGVMHAADVRMLTDANVVAHLATGDSLEVALSQIGADRAQSSSVRDFARRMVTEHSAHMQTARQVAAQGGITPASSPADTADAAMATRVTDRLSAAPAGADFDRRFMRAEVMMHQHMLRELEQVQPQAAGAARQLVSETIPVVRQHLADAQALWRQVGGGNDRRGPGSGSGR